MRSLTTFDYYSTSKQYWGDQSPFVLVPVDGCVGPPVFLKERGDPAVVGRNTFVCSSPLARKVSRECVRLSVMEGRVMMAVVRGSTSVRFKKNWVQADWHAVGADPVFLAGGACVQLYPEACAFEVRDLRSPASPEWVGQNTGFVPASTGKRRPRLRKQACRRATDKENAGTVPSVCPGCNDVVCSCIPSTAQEEDAATATATAVVSCEWPNLTVPTMVNVTSTGESTPPVRSRADDYSDLEDEVQRPHRMRSFECPICEQPYAGSFCESCNVDPDSHEYQGM